MPWYAYGEAATEPMRARLAPMIGMENIFVVVELPFLGYKEWPSPKCLIQTSVWLVCKGTTRGSSE